MKTEGGQNWYQFTMPKWTPSREFHKRFQRRLLLLFDAIPTSWISKHYSVRPILFQRRSSVAVAAQRRCVLKYPFFLARGEKLV